MVYLIQYICENNQTGASVGIRWTEGGLIYCSNEKHFREGNKEDDLKGDRREDVNSWSQRDVAVNFILVRFQLEVICQSVTALIR